MCICAYAHQCVYVYVYAYGYVCVFSHSHQPLPLLKKLVVPAANETGPATLWALVTLEIKEQARRDDSGSQKRTAE